MPYPESVWLIYADNGIPPGPVLWTEPCPFPVDDGEVVTYHRADLPRPEAAARIAELEAEVKRMRLAAQAARHNLSLMADETRHLKADATRHNLLYFIDQANAALKGNPHD